MSTDIATDSKASQPVDTKTASNGSLEVTGSEDDKKKAVRQFEFYFDDSNLPYDKFMWGLHTANEEHWVPIATIATFKRMRPYSHHGKEWLLDALRENAEILEIDEKGEMCRRTTEPREITQQDILSRSVYAKGFGEEHPGLQRELEEYFSQYGRVKSLRMRRTEETSEFKGSVFVEFDSPATAKTFLSLDPIPQWKGETLLTYSKEEYCEMKIKEKGLSGKSADFRRRSILGTPGGRKGFNAFREMNAKSGVRKEKPEVFLDFMGKRIKVYEEDGEGKIKEDEYETVPKATLKFEGLKGECQWTDIKDPLREHFSKAPYVKFEMGDTSGLVGFDRTLSEGDLDYVKEHVKTVSGEEVTWSYCDEDENRVYQLERAQHAAKRALGASMSRDSRGGRGGRGGRRGGRGGRRDGRETRRNKESDSMKEKSLVREDGVPEAGDKRKRGIEPDGGVTQGLRGDAARVPVVGSAKKAKVDES